MIAEPAPSLTDLLLGVVVVTLAIQLRHTPMPHRHWQATFWWAGTAALAGSVHHGVILRWPRWAEVSWAIISLMVVLAVSYMLAATVAEVLGPGRAREFWLLRSVGVVAYVVLAATGHGGVTTILACESLTMVSVLVLWSWATLRRHPLAVPVLVAIMASSAAAAIRALNPSVTSTVGLDPTSVYHLAQIVGMVLLYRAVSRPRPAVSDVEPAVSRPRPAASDVEPAARSRGRHPPAPESC